jgi:hypothetical protein
MQESGSDRLDKEQQMSVKRRDVGIFDNRGSAINPVGLESSGPYWRGWATAWAGVVVLAFVNGVLHRSYQETLGEHRAHQVSCVVLLILLAPWVWRTERRHPLPSTSAALRVGLAWAAAKVIFEFVFGRYVNQNSWAKLLNDYDLSEGRLWVLDVVGITAAPALARAWRLRRDGRRGSL